MKVFKNQDSFLTSLTKNEIKVVLFYGKDLGLISFYSQIAASNLVSQNFSKHVLFANELKDNTKAFENTLQSNDLFAGEASSKCIILKGDFPKLVEILKSVVPHMQDTIVLIEAGDLLPSSKLRAFCDKEQNTASVACYQETEGEVKTYVASSLKEDGYKIEQDALNFVATKLGNNKMVTKQEIEKLKLYKLDDKNISLEDVSLAIGQNDNIAIDKIINACYSKSLGNLHSHIEEETLKNIGVMPIVRSLLNHCLKLITIKLLLREKNDFEVAVTTLKPPMFYKQKNEIRSYINLWSLKSLFEVYNELILQEISVKKNSPIAEIILQNTCIKIANYY